VANHLLDAPLAGRVPMAAARLTEGS
jgi:hypothetical protein